MQGDHAKVLKLLDEQGASLHRLLGRLTRCEHATSDLMQELFVKLAESRGFAASNDPYAYAWRTATNLAFEWYRRRRMQSENRLSGQSKTGQTPALERMIADEQLELVLEMTARLKGPARDVIVMRFIEQKSYEEIARRLGKNPNYLRSLCSKSLRRLQEMIDGHFRTQAERQVSHG